MRTALMTAFVARNCDTPVEVDVERVGVGAGQVKRFERGGMQNKHIVMRRDHVAGEREAPRKTAPRLSGARSATGAAKERVGASPICSVNCLSAQGATSSAGSHNQRRERHSPSINRATLRRNPDARPNCASAASRQVFPEQVNPAEVIMD
jgi:hypothetical protein